MRKCLRCGTEMKENCAIKVEGAGYGIVMSSDENKLFGGRIGKPKVAICPEVRRSLHLCGRCREAVTVNGGGMK